MVMVIHLKCVVIQLLGVKVHSKVRPYLGQHPE